MPKSFKLPALDFAALTEPKVLVRAVLGVLFVANLLAAGFAFHWFDASPDALSQQLLNAQASQLTEQARLLRSRSLGANIARGKADGEKFIETSMTSRRRTYSTILGELTDTAKTAGIKSAAGTIALEPIMRQRRSGPDVDHLQSGGWLPGTAEVCEPAGPISEISNH